MSQSSAVIDVVSRHRKSAARDTAIDAYAQLQQGMTALQQHRVFSLVRSTADLHVFMRWHVFAVWDFMSLVKRLQRDLTCVSLPWVPPANPKAARLINEIVLGEESDEGLNGGHASHFELYLEAMREVGIHATEVLPFIRYLTSGYPIQQALDKAGVHPAVGRFVKATLETATKGQTHEVLGSFFYGRENVIPRMFSSLLESWTVDAASAPTFVYYLKRHIELDGDSHGPAAEVLIEEWLQGDALKRDEMTAAALNAIDHRMALWDALADQLSQQQLR